MYRGAIFAFAKMLCDVGFAEFRLAVFDQIEDAVELADAARAAYTMAQCKTPGSGGQSSSTQFEGFVSWGTLPIDD